MRILTLNIRHGGGRRIPAILGYVATSGADVVVLPEYRAGVYGEQLEEGLEGLGYAFRRRSVTAPRSNGVLLASRLAAEPIALEADEHSARRIVACRSGDLSIFGVHFALGAGKRRLYDLIAARSPLWTRSASIVVGDFNTGRHRIDEAGATFALTECFEALEREQGWTDAWRHFHGTGAREFTWHSPRGNGFRLDHVFASRPALGRIRAVAYDHATRPAITDHSALIVDLT